MALGKEPYKHLYAADLTALRELSVMAERVYVHLACGERSSACCVASCDPEHLRYSVRARRTAEVTDALTELEAAGWLVLDLPMKQAWLPVQARRTWIVSEASATGWRNDLSRFKSSLATLQATEFIEAAAIAPDKGRQRTTELRSSISSSNRSSISTVAKATVTSPFPANEANGPFPAVEQQEPPQTDDPWAKLSQQYADPLLAHNPDHRPKSKLLPHLQHKLAVSDAVAKGILPPEPQQLAMDLPAGKPAKKPLSDAQLDAIFAKRKMMEVCNHWNQIMASKNAPVVPKTVMAKAGTLMANFARFQHREPLEDARWLFNWAMEVDPYHSGRQGKPWTLQAWLSADHLSAVFAAYRTYTGEAKQFTMDIDRTLRDWRLAVETAELNNKLAEQREAA